MLKGRPSVWDLNKLAIKKYRSKLAESFKESIGLQWRVIEKLVGFLEVNTMKLVIKNNANPRFHFNLWFLGKLIYPLPRAREKSEKSWSKWQWIGYYSNNDINLPGYFKVLEKCLHVLPGAYIIYVSGCLDIMQMMNWRG